MVVSTELLFGILSIGSRILSVKAQLWSISNNKEPITNYNKNYLVRLSKETREMIDIGKTPVKSVSRNMAEGARRYFFKQN